MTEPTCRTCYANTLPTPAERARFFAEPVTTPVYYCPEHQRAMDLLFRSIDWSKVIWQGSVTGRLPRSQP